MEFGIVLKEILVLFIIMLLGFAANKRKVIDENTQRSISKVLMKIALPSLVLSSSNIQGSSEVLPNIISIFLITTVSFVFFIILATILAKPFKLKKSMSNVFISLIVFANVGFMGYPIAYALFGEIGVFYASVLNLVFSLFLWTYGILLYNTKGNINFRNLVNIGTISSVTAVAFFIFDIKLPYSLQTALELCGKMTTPLSMLIIGGLISEVDFRAVLQDTKILLISFIRLIAAPILTASLLKLFQFNSTVIAICSVMAAMPSAATNTIFAKEFDAEPKFASVGVFFSTLLSIVTLPAILYLLSHIFGLIHF